jgi:hypothetical protein
MNDIAELDQVVTREKVEELQRVISAMPQFDGFITNHYFADGMYCRSVWRPAGCLIVGKVHKKEHFYIVASGKVSVTTDEGVKEITGPQVIVSQPGTKRAVFAHEDSTCITVHRTDKRDFDELEKDLVEDDPSSMYTFENKVKNPAIEGDVLSIENTEITE